MLHVICTRLRLGLLSVGVGESEVQFVCLLVGCLTSQQQASVSQGRICSDNLTCCHTEIEDADQTFYLTQDRLVGLVVKVSASGAEDPGFESRLRRDFSGSSHTSDLKIGTPVTTLPGAWHYRVSAGTGRPGVSIL